MRANPRPILGDLRGLEWRFAAAFALAFSLAACRGCSSGTGGDPRVHLAGTSEAVVELSDLARLPELRADLEDRFTEIIPAEDIANAQIELRRILGFDPLSKEGLKQAGLPPRGSVAGSISGDTALWVFPVLDGERVTASVAEMVEARSTAERSEVTLSGTKVVVFGRSFGDELVEVAALAIRGQVGFLGLGPKAQSEVGQALDRKPEQSILSNPVYKELTADSGGDWLLRSVLPQGGQALRDTLKQAGRRARVRVREEAAEAVTAASWALNLDENGLQAQGRLRLEEKALKDTQAVFSGAGKLSEGTRQLDIAGTALFAAVNGNAQELIERLAPSGSRARRQLTTVLSDVSLKSEEEVLNELTGQGSLAMGLGDLANVSLAQLVGNPMSVAWTALAVGVKNPEEFSKVSEAQKKSLEERGFEVLEVALEHQRVTRIVPASNKGGILVESFARPGAVVFSNEPAVTRGIITTAPALDPFKGKPGILVEARFQSITNQLRTFDLTKIPLVFRAIAKRGVDALSLFDRLQVLVRPQETGLSFEAQLTLAPKPESP